MKSHRKLSPDAPRQFILDFVETSREYPSLRALSLGIGRNHAYFDQYVKHWKPRDLPEKVREILAEKTKAPEWRFLPEDRRPLINKSSLDNSFEYLALKKICDSAELFELRLLYKVAEAIDLVVRARSKVRQ